jgi:CRP-like cAMP-binding protein
MEAFKNFLKQFPHYTPEMFEKLEPSLSVINLETEAYFLKRGQTCRQLAFIEKGLVRIYYLHDGKEITKCFCRENAITCSYSSMITQRPSESSIQAMEETKLIVLSYAALQELYKKNIFWQQMGRIAGEREFIIEETHNQSMRNLSALDRYKHILENESELLHRVPLNHIASYLQITPETLSRIRKKIIGT